MAAMAGENVSPHSAESQEAGVASGLLAQLKAHPAKAALLCGLAVVLAVLLIRAAVKPSSASAKVVELAVPQNPTVIFQNPAVHDSELALGRVGSDESDLTTEPKDIQNTRPRRDRFAIELSYFTQ